jgi:TRAP-type C4-dicarboxylate transport system permease small subunit
MTFSGRASRFFDLILDAGGALASILMIVVMVMVCVKAFARYVLGSGMTGADQISGTLLLYITFLGAAWVLKQGKHITVDILYVGLGPRARRWADVMTSAMCAAVCLVVVLFGTLEVVESWQRDIRVAAEIEMSRAINLVVIPLGCLLLSIQFARRTVFLLASAANVRGN